MEKIFREIADTYRFFFSTPPTYKQIVLYLEHKGYYPYLAGIVTELIETHHQNLCYITSDFFDPLLAHTRPRMRVFYLNAFLPYVMAFLNARVCLMTVADLEYFSLRRSAYPVHYVYVFHALVSTHMMYREGAFDHYDSILCVGPHQVDEIRERERQELLPPKYLVEAGYYPVERIYARYQHEWARENSSVQKTVLIAPSWGEQNIFETVGEVLIRSLLQKGYRVVIRPHPELMRRKPQVIKTLQHAFADNTCFGLDTSDSADTALVNADVLVTDSSGITFEYAFGTERPILFIDVPPKIKNSHYKKLGMEPIELALRKDLGIILSPHEIVHVGRAVESLIAARDSYWRRIITLRSQYMYAFGNASKIGAEYIMSLLK